MNFSDLYKHQKLQLEVDIAGYDSCNKFMVVNNPTAFGKTHLLPFLYLALRERDPDLKMIIATSQIEQVTEIVEAFSCRSNIRMINIRGIESQIIEIAGPGSDEKRLRKAKRECLDFINKAYKGSGKGSAPESELDKIKNNFIKFIDNAVSDCSAIIGIKSSIENNRLQSEQLEEFIASKRITLRSNYTKAEKIIEKAARHIAEIHANMSWTDTKEKKSRKEKREIINKEYIKVIQYIPEAITWMFSDLPYEAADVVVLTHAKANRSILTKRNMKLSDISYENEGKHIVFIADEAENGRENYIDIIVEQAVRNETDMLPFLNQIYNILNEKYFDSQDYITRNQDGTVNKSVSEAANDLKKRLDDFLLKYEYVPNMHMADMLDVREIPQITNCSNYLIQKNAKNRFIRTDPGAQSVKLVAISECPKESGCVKDAKESEITNDNTTLISFVKDAQSIIRQFVGIVRKAGDALNRFREAEGKYEERYESLESVLYRVFGSKKSSASRYVMDNTYPRYGAKHDPESAGHPYRSNLSYINIKAGNSYGGDTSLSYAGVSSFPEAEMENIISNVRFTYLLSGTGWLPALNNYDFSYLADKCGQYIPPKKDTEAIHDAYMNWKAAQYKDTQFVVKRISGKSSFKYREKDIDIACEFIVEHMELMKEYDIYGGTGAFIFPPRGLDAEIIKRLKSRGINMDKIVILQMKGGDIKELSNNGLPQKSDRCKKEGDTFLIDVSDNRFYYVITAYRSGNRGYNIAFKNRENIYDASGICLFDLTNIIPQRTAPGKDEQLNAKKIAKEDVGRILTVNMAYIHCILMNDGKISTEVMKRVNWLIKKISYDPDVIGKDLYPENLWSPYKLQGTSEILQALGRIRNNKKTPVIFIALSNGIFSKCLLREEPLKAEYLSYEATEVNKILPDLWREFECENESAKLMLDAAKEEKRLSRMLQKLVKKELPLMKKKAVNDPAILGELSRIIESYEEAKVQAVSLNLNTPLDLNKAKGFSAVLKAGMWLGGHGICDPKTKAYPFMYHSYYDNSENRTVYTMNKLDGITYLSPGSMLLVETAELFSCFCKERLRDNISEIMNEELLCAIKEKDMFPYAPSKYCYDILLGEYGERLFDSIMEEAEARGMTEFSCTALPSLQYEDYDRILLDKDAGIAGYVNVKYRKVTEFDLEKNLNLYEEKILRCPLKGKVRILYINMRPSGERTEKLYTSTNNHQIKMINDILYRHGKEMEIYALSPFTLRDIYGTSEMITETISTYMIKKINHFFMKPVKER